MVGYRSIKRKDATSPHTGHGKWSVAVWGGAINGNKEERNMVS